MKQLKLFFLLFLLLAFSCKQSEKKSPVQHEELNATGNLFIIGGGNRDSALMEELMVISDWKVGDLISVVTMASGWGDSAYIWLNDEFKKLTHTNITCVKIDSSTVKNPLVLDSLKNSKLVFLSGGDQSVLMKHIKGTEFKLKINEAYQHGATIAGTSAGAALMSEKMITGNQLKDTIYASAIPVLWQGNVEIVEGLGFLDSIIIDQHFVVRSRHNRLLSAVLENPKFIGIGIDEATAIIVHGDSAKVAGESQVFVYRNPNEIKTSGENLIGVKNISLSIYLPGEKFSLKK